MAGVEELHPAGRKELHHVGTLHHLGEAVRCHAFRGQQDKPSESSGCSCFTVCQNVVRDSCPEEGSYGLSSARRRPCSLWQRQLESDVLHVPELQVGHVYSACALP